MQIVAMASGTGTNFRAICQGIEKGEIQAQIIGLIVDKPEIKALEVAKEFGIETYIIDYKQYRSRSEFNKAILEQLKMLNPDLICLAGYMRIIDEDIINNYENKIINIHPSLLPKYPGLHAIDKAVIAGEQETGVTTHFVDAGMDTGPIIKQAKFSISGLKLDEVYEKLKPIEHQLYIDTLKEVLGE